uniref:Uncharacterized protein n=1 Tax=Meloidogyne incognita TaxID=6306 RepID=A0A914LK26_MELIC
MIKFIKNKHKYFAQLLNKYLAEEDHLLRILVNRSEIDLGNIIVEYNAMHEKTLGLEIKMRFKGAFQARKFF